MTRRLKGVAALGMLLALSVGSRRAAAEDAETAPPAVSAPAPAGEEVVACVRAAEDAQSQRSAHRLRAAFKHLLVCAQSNCPTVVRTDCVYWLAEVEKLLPSVIVQAKDKDGGELTDVSVSMDGEPLVSRLDGLSVPVDPGARTFRFEHVGSTPIEKRIVIREGDKGRRITITFDPRPALPPKPPPAPRRSRIPAASIVFGGIGAGALGSFAYFGLSGRKDAAELGEGCGRNKTCREDQVAPIRTKLLIADVSLGVGLVSLGAAAYVFFTQREPKPPSTVSAEVVVGRQATLVSVRAPF